MTDNDAALTPAPTRQAAAIPGRSSPGKVTGKLRRAIEAMVWEGARRKEAAQIAGIKDHSLRAALKKPHVLAHYRSELEVLRESERARNLLRLCEIRDQDDNKGAAVKAIQVLDGDKEQRRTNIAVNVVMPGIIIDLSEPLAHEQTLVSDEVIEIHPESVPNSG